MCFFWFIIAFFIGLTLIRNSTAGIMPQLQQMQMTGQLGNDPTVTKKLAYAFAGFINVARFGIGCISALNSYSGRANCVFVILQ